MSLRINFIYKAHQPGDVATFDAAESQHIVASGLGLVETVEHDYEEPLKDLHLTLPAASVTGIAAVGQLRPSIAEPTTRAAGAIPPHMTPAASAAPSAVVDSRAGQPALERASATPMPLASRDPHVERGLSTAADVAARGDAYAAAGAVTGVSDDDLARTARMQVPGPGAPSESAKPVVAKVDAPKVEAPKVEAAKVEAAKVEAAAPKTTEPASKTAAPSTGKL